MSSIVEQTPPGSIAVVGMAGRFPGADSIERFWQNLVQGVESISRFSDEELRAAGVDPQLLANPDFVKARGQIVDPEGFDAAFFGISPREAELMDPQQRLFLETCWHAIEHAGLAPHLFSGSIGVWGGMSTGMSNNTYLLANLHAHGRLAPEDVLPVLVGNENDYLTTRVSYKLNLRGPSVNVQSACSTSLVAVAQACHSLLTWQCDAALAGGVSVSYPQKDGYLYHEGGIGSPDGHCRPFDVRAAGTVFSNGVGVVVLRRLEDALADGQTVYAVVRGAATNNDGAAKVSFAAPSVDGQADVIATALATADVSPDTIDYVEAHGTGTPLGDPIEVAALTMAFRTGGSMERAYCGLGSVKSNVGHLDAAAGVAGFIKTVLALHHRQLPPTLHFERPSPACDLPNSPFYVVDRLADWSRRGHPRRAAVSSFGIGGTNAHVILEEAPEQLPAPEQPSPSEVVVLSAKTATALEAATIQLATHLEANPAVSLADVATTLQLGRQAMAHRRVVVGSSPLEAASALRGRESRRTATGVASFGTRAVAFMFPGGGTQYVDMARQLLPHAAVFRESLETCMEWLASRCDVRTTLFPSADLDRALAPERLEQPSYSLPALFAVEYALARQWMAWGVRPAALIGHSMGEYTAACLAGVMPVEDALSLVLLRGRLFETLAPGGMLGVPLPASEVVPHLGADLAIAAINAPMSCVVSGPADALASFSGVMADGGITCRRLRIAVAAHSPMVAPILDEFASFVGSLSLHPPTMPVVSNLTGTWLTADQACSVDYWTDHLRQTVRFADGLGTLLAESNRVLLEVGPGQALSTFAQQHPSRANGQVVQHSIRHPKEGAHDLAVLQLAAGRLWTVGVDLEWSTVSGRVGRRVALPGYPFERSRFYVAAPAPANVQAVPIPAAAANQIADVPVPRSLVMAQPVVLPLGPTRSRAERICDRLAALLHALSGVPRDQIDPRLSFLEMGFDSLFLTQASLKFKAEFGVRITFRQLFEDAPTLQALSAYIDGKLAADAFPLPAPPPLALPPAMVPAAATHTSAASTPAAPSTLLERVIHEQLQLMAEQLRLLHGTGTSAPSAEQSDAAVVRPEASAELAQPERFGPFVGIDKSAQALTSHQQASLDRLIERYVRRTQKSKALTAEQRSRLADPRAVGGFRKIWKEMTYQIATVRSAGSRMWDVDGNEYIDLTSGFGVNLFGYDVPEVAEALHRQIGQGIELGTLSPLAKEAAELICDITGMERATFANTGSEAIAGAIRAVRTATGKDWIVVFDDEYHGIAEEVLVKSVVDQGRWRSAPAAPGIPDHLVGKVIVLHYDDPRSIDIIRERADDIAGVIIEPVQNRHPDFRPTETIRAVRSVTSSLDIPLIFDEMITGFRLHPRGAQGFFGVDADVVCYGKIMSGGLPIAAIAGKAAYLDAFDGGPWQFGDDSFPEGGVTFFGGTFTRNVLSLSASVAALRKVKQLDVSAYQELNDKANRFVASANALFAQYGGQFHLEHCGSICNLAFRTDDPLTRLFYFYMRDKGIHLWDRPFFISFAHSEAELGTTLTAIADTLAEMKEAQFIGAGANGAITPVETVPHDDLLLLTEAQMEIWLGGQMSETASCSFNEVVALDLRGALDIAALQRAVDGVVARHEALRMTVSHQPLGFRRHASLAVPIDLRDVTELAVDARTAALERAIAEGDGRPFDLATGPLLRVTLVRLTAEHNVLVVAAHHLVCDGWSFGVVLNDLCACYSAEVFGRQPALGPAMQASEYAHMLSSDHFEHDRRAAERFWVSQYETVPEPLELPADRPRPRVQTHRGGRISLRYEAPLAGGLKALATQERATMFTALLGVFETLIYRLSGQSDFVVGIPIAAQSSLDNQNLVTHAVNFVPLRCTVDGTRSFRELLSQVRRKAYDINEHQNFTYGTLLQKLRLARDRSRSPLVSVSFTLEPAPEALPMHGLRAELMAVARGTSKNDLHMNVMEIGGGLLVEVDYSSDVFDETTVREWLAHYRTLIASVVASPDLPVAELALLDDAEQRHLVEQWNGLTVSAPSERLIHQRVEHYAALQGDRPAVVCENERMTWAELNRRANRLARGLVRLGVAPGSRVGVCLERSIEFIVGLVAVHKAGAAYVPLDPDHPADRLHFLATDASLRAVVTGEISPRGLPSFAVPVIAVDDTSVSREADDDLGLTYTPDAVAYVIYTSGSTGQPKGVEVEHRQLLNYTAGIVERLAVPPGSSYALVSTVAADLGHTAIFPALATGGVLHVVLPWRATNGHALAEYFAPNAIDVLKITPSHLAALMADNPGEQLLPRRCLVLGGEVVQAAWAAQLQAVGGSCKIVNEYGPTETTVGALTYQLRDDAAALPGRSLPVGQPLGNVQAYVLDDRLKPVPVGVAGELYIGGAGVARGYLDRPELTRERFIPDPFAADPAGRIYKTGDRARRLRSGDIEFLGRTDSQVKIRGFRLELGEVEAVLRAIPTVTDAVVLLREDAPGDQRLVAYVSGASIVVDDLRAYAARKLPAHAVPAAFVTMTQWPLTANGKRDRSALPKPSLESAASTGPSIAPRSTTEVRVADIWCELLEVSSVGANDDFFLLGGHSLLAIRLVNRLFLEFGVSLPPGTLLELSRLRDLAKYLEAAPSVLTAALPPPDPDRLLVRIAAGGRGHPFFWVHGEGGEVFGFMQLSGHLAADRDVYGFSADWSREFVPEDRVIDTIADRYVAELRKVRPRGPYHLGGFCSGAVLMIEIARQLEEAGEQIGALAVLDYKIQPSRDDATAVRSAIAFARNFPRWITDDAVPSGASDLIGRVKSRLRRAMKRTAAQEDIRDGTGMWRFPDHQVEMLKVHHQVIHSFSPRPINSRVTLFLPRAAPLFGPWVTGHDPGWKRIALGGVDVEPVRGSHSTMLAEPFAAQLAGRLRACIERAERQFADSSATDAEAHSAGIGASR